MITDFFTIFLRTSLHNVVAAAVHAQCFKRSWEPSFIAGVLAIPGTFGLLVLQDWDRETKPITLQPTGLIICRSIFDVWEAEILTVGVVPEVRGLGLGYLLVRKIQHLLTGETIFLEVAVDNISAITLYKKLGFKPVGRRSHYYPRNDGVADDAFVFRANAMTAETLDN